MDELKVLVSAFAQPNSLFSFVILMVPGFVSVKAYMLHVPTAEKKTSDFLIDIVVFSLFNDVVWLVILSVLTALHKLPGKMQDYPGWTLVVLAILALVVTPILWTVLYIVLRNQLAPTGLIMGPQPTAWDKVFTRSDKMRVIVHLSDNRVIGGIWEHPSYASGYPAAPELYLPKAWTVCSDERTLEKEIAGSKGVLLFGKDIVSIEFFEML